MAIDLIAKIAPKNNAFTGMVDANQVLGDGATNVLPANTIPNLFVFGTGLVRLTVGTTAPVAPTIGDLWVDTN